MQQQGSPGAITSIRLRGQRQYDTAVLLDGLRVRDASDIGGSAASLTSDLVAVAADRLEILRGSGSSIYGTNAIGGVVNIVPETASPGLHFEAGAEGGGLKTFRERFKVSGGNGRAAFSLGLNRLDVRRGIDGQDQYGNSAGAGRFLFAPSSSITISANLYGTIANARLNDSPFALPGAFTGSEPFPRAIAGVTFQPDFNNPDEGRRNRLLVGSVKLTQQINERLSYSVAYQPGLQVIAGITTAVKLIRSLLPSTLLAILNSSNVNKGTTDTIDARLNAQLARTNLATFGFEYERESLFQQAIPSFSAFNNTTDRQRTFAIFGQDQISLFDDRLQLSFGVRGQFFRIRAADRPSVLSGINAEKSITGDAGVAYFIRSTNTKLRAHVGTVFARHHFSRGLAPGPFQAWACKGLAIPRCERSNRSASMAAWINGSRAIERLSALLTFIHISRASVEFQSFFVVDPLGLGRFEWLRESPRVDLREGWRALSKLRRGVGRNYERLTPTQIAIDWCHLLDYNRSM